MKRRTAIATGLGLSSVAAFGGYLAVAGEEAPQHKKRVFAHYVPWFPLSLDNEPRNRDYYATQLTQPSGEKGKHLSSAGYIRDRPLSPEEGLAGDWRSENAATEVRWAVQAGLDGFGVDITDLGEFQRESVLRLLRAAETSGAFSIFLHPDMSVMRGLAPEDLASYCAALMTHPAYARGDTGGAILSPFAAERMPNKYWATVMQLLADQGVTCEYWPIIVDPHATKGLPLAARICPWGVRSPDEATEHAKVLNDITDQGVRPCAPLVLWDARPAQFLFGESRGSELAVSMLRAALSAGARELLLVTWNDFAESTNICPSTNNGFAKLSFIAWFVEWFRQGEVPAMSAGYVLARRATLEATSSAGDDRPNHWEGSAQPKNRVEVLGNESLRPVVSRDGVAMELVEERITSSLSRSVLKDVKPGVYMIATDRTSVQISILSSVEGYDMSYYVTSLK